ncbi:MAG: electron transport complex subunit RsxE [Lachnospiraceae bacterium]|nr:electron transport complex subunit RsxE [Lachnospiraceae bacterium]
MSELSERLLNGILKENPTFVLLLGMCPTLAVTTCAVNGLGMGVTTMVVLALSNLFISLLRKVIPDKIRIPAFIVIIASFVTMVELLLKAYIPSLYSALGLYIPLIVVNCIILGRAEAYAYSHGPFLSLFDGIGMGMGFTIALTIIGSFRELLGAGTLFNANVMPKGYVPVSIFIMAPGAFFVLAMLTAIQNAIKISGEKKGKDMSKIQSGCGKDCEACATGCSLKPKDEVKARETEESKEKAVVKKEEKIKPDKKETKEDKPETESSNEEALTKEDKPLKTKEKTSKSKKEAAKKEEVKEVTEVKEEVKDDNDELELLDLTDYKNAIKKTQGTAKKPTRKKASLEKAQAMLFKAEKELKEENND